MWMVSKRCKRAMWTETSRGLAVSSQPLIARGGLPTHNRKTRYSRHCVTMLRQRRAFCRVVIPPISTLNLLGEGNLQPLRPGAASTRNAASGNSRSGCLEQRIEIYSDSQEV